MKSKTSLAAASLLLLAGCGGGEHADYGPETASSRPAPDVPPAEAGAAYDLPQSSAPLPGDPAAGATGPRGSSQPGPGERRYDEVGFAGVRSVAGGGPRDEAVVAVHPTLPANSYVEVTSLDNGRTILVLVTGTGNASGSAIDLSPGAARQLGYDKPGTIPVRIRAVMASPQDQVALRSGRAAEARADAPPVLLNALRKRLPAGGMPVVQAPPPPIAARPPGPARAARTVRPAATGRYFVQVAALSTAGRAQALAQSMGGFVKAGGGLYRVQLGPFANAGEAQAARAKAARAGYGDARIFTVR
ncbi:MAG: SPOR domain-containing protein [Sphingomonas sp.]